MADAQSGAPQHDHVPFTWTWKTISDLVLKTYDEWSIDNAPRLGAALAFYTLLSIAPLLVIVIAVCGFVLGEEAARGGIVAQLQDLMGYEGAQAIQTLIANSRSKQSGILASVIGLVTLFFGATSVVAELRDAMNQIWNVPPKRAETGLGSVLSVLRERSYAFAVVFGVGFLLLVSLVLSAWIAGVSDWIGTFLPISPAVLQLINLLLSFLIIAALFAAMFKALPDVRIEWKDVAIGALSTALLFSLGKMLIGIYIGRSGFSSTYGAAGSLVIVLVWVYYSAQLFFFGAEFTQVYANQYGSRPSPRSGEKLPDSPKLRPECEPAPKWQSQSPQAHSELPILPSSPVPQLPYEPTRKPGGLVESVGSLLGSTVVVGRTVVKAIKGKR